MTYLTTEKLYEMRKTTVRIGIAQRYAMLAGHIITHQNQIAARKGHEGLALFIERGHMETMDDDSVSNEDLMMEIARELYNES